MVNDPVLARFCRDALLIIPFRHTPDFFKDDGCGAAGGGRRSILLPDAKTILEEKFRPDGYNIGFLRGRSGRADF